MRKLADTSTSTTSRTRLPPKNLGMPFSSLVLSANRTVAGYPLSRLRRFRHACAESFGAQAMVDYWQAIRAGFPVFLDAEFRNRARVHQALRPRRFSPQLDSA